MAANRCLFYYLYNMKRIILLLFLLFSFNRIYPCDCTRPDDGPPKSDVAFRGKVISIKKFATGKIDSFFVRGRLEQVVRYNYEITFAADSVIKGDVYDTMKIFQVSLEPEACGIRMMVQDKYLVYATYASLDNSPGIQLYTSACTETRKLP